MRPIYGADRIAKFLIGVARKFRSAEHRNVVARVNGALGVIHSSRWATGHLNELRLRVYGEKGAIEVQHRHDWSKLIVCLGDDAQSGTWREVDVPPVPTNYQRFAEAVRTGKNDQPDFRHAANLQKVLDLAIVSDSGRREFALRADRLA